MDVFTERSNIYKMNNTSGFNVRELKLIIHCGLLLQK